MLWICDTSRIPNPTNLCQDLHTVVSIIGLFFTSTPNNFLPFSFMFQNLTWSSQGSSLYYNDSSLLTFKLDHVSNKLVPMYLKAYFNLHKRTTTVTTIFKGHKFLQLFLMPKPNPRTAFGHYQLFSKFSFFKRDGYFSNLIYVLHKQASTQAPRTIDVICNNLIQQPLRKGK